jgi:hypothetical protein
MNRARPMVGKQLSGQIFDRFDRFLSIISDPYFQFRQIGSLLEWRGLAIDPLKKLAFHFIR